MYLNPTPRHTLTYTTYTYTHLLHLRPHLPSTPKPTLTSSTFSQSFTNWPLLLGFLLGAIAMQCIVLWWHSHDSAWDWLFCGIFYPWPPGLLPCRKLVFSSLLALWAIVSYWNFLTLGATSHYLYKPLPDVETSSLQVLWAIARCLQFLILSDMSHHEIGTLLLSWWYQPPPLDDTSSLLEPTSDTGTSSLLVIQHINRCWHFFNLWAIGRC